MSARRMTGMASMMWVPRLESVWHRAAQTRPEKKWGAWESVQSVMKISPSEFDGEDFTQFHWITL